MPAEVPFRRELELALDSVNTAWEDDQRSQAARRLLAANAAAIRGWLERFDELVRISSADNVDVVITHGEPHSGNIVRSGTHFALVDWDTVDLRLASATCGWSAAASHNCVSSTGCGGDSTTCPRR